MRFRGISRSYNCIKNILARDGDYKHGGGTSKKRRERNKQQITRKVSTEGAKSLRKIKSELNLSVSKYTIRKFRKEGYKYKKAKKQPALTHEKEQKRFLLLTDQMECSITGVWTERRENGMDRKISLKVWWFAEVLEQTEQLRYTSATGTWIQNITSTYYKKTTCRFTNQISFLCKITPHHPHPSPQRSFSDNTTSKVWIGLRAHPIQ